MATLGTLEYLISIKDNNVESDLKKSETKVKNWGDKLSSWTVAKGQMIARFSEKAVSAVAGVMKNTIKSAVNSYAEYEQLEGGIKKLFGDDYRKVMNNASKAFMTAGVSANEYMQTVADFSASLVNSLGGDTAEAARVADQALIDMADNANMFGSSMESIQNAYKGFAKQNYTMLDNLKLGYGGTRTEMERLLKDAEAYQRTQGKTVKYSINNLNDVYEAIHAIQQKMEIAGTTQDEAMRTVEGSMKAAKAAWQDVLVAMGSGKGVKQAIKNFSKTAKVAMENMKPVVMDTVKGLVVAAQELFPVVVDTAKDVVNYLGRSIFGKDWDITINWIQNAWKDVNDAITEVGKWVGNAYKVTVEWVQNAWKAVNDAFNKAVHWIDESFRTVINWGQNAWDAVSNAFTVAAEWVDKAFDTTINWVRKGWQSMLSAFSTAGAWVGKAFDTVVNFVRGSWNTVKEAITQVGQKVWDNVVNFTLGLFKGVSDFIAGIPEAINVAVNFIKKVIDDTGENLKVAGENTFGDDMTAAEAMEYVKTGKLPENTWYNDSDGWEAKGNWSVPYDNYRALLHRGELVMNKSQARRFRDGGSADYSAIGSMIGDAVNSAMSKVYVMMSGEKVGDLTTKRVKRNINTSSYSRLRAMGG